MSTEDASDDSEIVLRLVPEWEKEELRLPIPAKGVLNDPVDRGINIFLEIESCIDSYIEIARLWQNLIFELNFLIFYIWVISLPTNVMIANLGDTCFVYAYDLWLPYYYSKHDR